MTTPDKRPAHTPLRETNLVRRALEQQIRRLRSKAAVVGLSVDEQSTVNVCEGRLRATTRWGGVGRGEKR